MQVTLLEIKFAKYKDGYLFHQRKYLKWYPRKIQYEGL